MENIYLSVQWTCTGCWEDPEPDDEGGMICRRCKVQFASYSDGEQGQTVAAEDFDAIHGSRPPRPTRQESMATLMASLKGADRG